MYCPLCGAKLENKTQKYCQNCGTDISMIKKHEQKASFNHTQKNIKSIVPKNYNSPPSMEQVQANTCAGKCLSLAVVSVLFSGIGVGICIVKIYRNWVYEYMFPEIPFIGIILSEVSLGLSFIGLILSFVSKSYCRKSSKLEPYNDNEEKGSTLAIFGIILGLITLGLSSFGLIRSLISAGFITF